MRVVTLVAVVVAALSMAAAAYAWTTDGASYTCKGSSRSVFCKETNWKPAYRVSIIPGWISVEYAGELIFGCRRALTPEDNCTYYGP